MGSPSRGGRRSARLEPWRLFLRAHAAVVDRLEKDLRERLDLPLAWYEVLLRLAHAGGRMRMTDLSRSLLLSKSGATRIVDRMEEARLVKRVTCPSDRRGAFATMTARGESLYAKAAPVHLAGVEEHFLRHVSPAEARALQSALTKIVDALEADERAAAS